MVAELIDQTGDDRLSAPAVARVQRRTLWLLCLTQIIGGIGVTIGISVGALLAARLAGAAVSGVASSAAVVGAALLAVPVTRLMNARGRRPGLVVAYVVGALGGVLVVVAAITRSIPLLFLGMLLFGGGSAANLQSRYSAVDLADPARRGRHLSLVVWATTIGAVSAPNFADVADRAMRHLGLPLFSGPFAFSVFAFALAAGLLAVLLRPDPLLTARRIAAAQPVPATSPGTPGQAAATARSAPTDVPGTVPADAVEPVVGPTSATPPAERPGGMRAALRIVASRPRARLGVAALAVGHLVMVGVMAMTPVHLDELHPDADVLRLVGFVLSLHIAGMYALSPVVGWLTDRFGRAPVILGGTALLLAACVTAGTAGHSTVRLTIGLFLLGLGWSATMVAGSTLLSESVPVTVRPVVQGLADLIMGLAAALAGALGGFVVEAAGYPVLTGLAAIAVVPLVALALRPTATGPDPSGAEATGSDTPGPMARAGAADRELAEEGELAGTPALDVTKEGA